MQDGEGRFPPPFPHPSSPLGLGCQGSAEMFVFTVPAPGKAAGLESLKWPDEMHM